MDDTITDTNNETEEHLDRGLGRRHLVWLGVLALVLLPLAAIDGPGRSVLERWGWVDRDERYTELYFPDHLALPDRARRGEPFGFDFSVRNREGVPTTYAWQVLIGPPGAATANAMVVASGELGLADDEVRVVHVEPDPEFVDDDAVVTVALVGRRETIHFPLAIDDTSDDTSDDAGP